MKSRNKKTGDIVEFSALLLVKDGKNGEQPANLEYPSLEAAMEEWEDYEEPKTINEIDVVLDAIAEYCDAHSFYSEDLEKIKILNIVEDKLKAWKRLKDNGLEVTEWSHGLYLDKNIVGRFRYEFPIDNKEVIEKDLDLLFGGEEWAN